MANMHKMTEQLELLAFLLFGVFTRVSAEGDSRYSNLFCEVGRRINDRPDDFHTIECKQWEDACQTKWEVKHDGRETIEKVCQTWEGCLGSRETNDITCYSDDAINSNNRLCFHCCQRDNCNLFDFVPSSSRGVEEIFQFRFDGSVSFDRGWDDYKNGFGNRHGEFWTGLENLHLLTSMYECDLQITIKFEHNEELDGTWRFFRVRSESENYRMTYDSYDGMLGNGLSPHKNYPFTTRDRDNDRNDRLNCAEVDKGGWWFGRKCRSSSLNGEAALRKFSIKEVQMKVVCENP